LHATLLILQVWTAPLEAAAIIALLLWRTGGVYGLPALGVVLVVLPLQYYFGYKIAQHKTANVEVSDARVLRMHEVLLAIKLVKFYVWEKSFARQVKEVRNYRCAATKPRGMWQVASEDSVLQAVHHLGKQRSNNDQTSRVPASSNLSRFSHAGPKPTVMY
jgi:hypothetical protein